MSHKVVKRRKQISSFSIASVGSKKGYQIDVFIGSSNSERENIFGVVSSSSDHHLHNRCLECRHVNIQA